MTAELWTFLGFLWVVVMGLVGVIYDNREHNFEVPNKVWIVFGIGGFILAGFRWEWVPLFLGLHFVWGAILSGGIFFAFWASKGAIGGADVKAIMALSVTLGLWSYIPVMFSVILVEFFLVYRKYSENLTWKDSIKISVPFLPFLFVGILGACCFYAWTVL